MRAKLCIAYGMTDGVSHWNVDVESRNVKVFRVAFVHGNVKYVVLYLTKFLILILSNNFFLCSVEIMNDASSGDDYESSSQPLKRNERYIVIAISIVLTVLINWFCQSLWNIGMLFCVLQNL